MRAQFQTALFGCGFDLDGWTLMRLTVHACDVLSNRFKLRRLKLPNCS